MTQASRTDAVSIGEPDAPCTIRPDGSPARLGASLLALGAGLVWSFGVLTARSAHDSDAWQYLLWRSIGIIVVIELVGLRARRARSARRSAAPASAPPMQPVSHPGPLRTQAWRATVVARAWTSGRAMHIATAGLLVASLGFVYALKNTTAANAAFLSSLTPVVAVVLARVVLGERLTRVTLVAVPVAMLGLLIMVLSDVGAGTMRGNVAAVCSSIGFAVYAVSVRRSPSTDWSPVMPGYSSAMVALCAVVTLVHGRTLLPPFGDVALALLHGGGFIVVGTTLFNVASRRLPAVAMTVFAQLETVCIPVWVLLRFGERPQRTTILGGAVILSAVLGQAVLGARTVRA